MDILRKLRKQSGREMWVTNNAIARKERPHTHTHTHTRKRVKELKAQHNHAVCV
jgi:hypothetical protein